MLLPTCRQMETSGTKPGVSLWSNSPFAPPSCPPAPKSSSSSLPSFLCAHQAERKLQSHTGRPQNLAAGTGSLPLLRRRDTSSPTFDTITQTERIRKCRCNIHVKITRLAARKHGSVALRNMLAFCIYEHSEVFCLRHYAVFVSALILFQCNIHRAQTVALQDSVTSTKHEIFKQNDARFPGYLI